MSVIKSSILKLANESSRLNFNLRQTKRLRWGRVDRRSERVGQTGFVKALLPQEARVAVPARRPVRRGVIAGRGCRKVQAELFGAKDDLRLGHRDQGSVDPEGQPPLDARFRSEVCRPFEGLEELRPAVGVTQ